MWLSDLKRNFHDKIFAILVLYGCTTLKDPKFLRVKFSRPDENAQNP